MIEFVALPTPEVRWVALAVVTTTMLAGVAVAHRLLDVVERWLRRRETSWIERRLRW